MDDEINGMFTLRSDTDGTWYELGFRPDRSQIWSANPDGFKILLRGEDRVEELISLVGPRHSDFATARHAGQTFFNSKLSRSQYWKYAS